MKEFNTIYASAARTATPAAVEFAVGTKGCIVIIDVSAVTATPAVTVTISGVDPNSDAIYTILASTAIATVSTTVLRVYPGLTASANATVSDVLPGAIRIAASHGDADSATYSVSYIGVD